MTPGTSWVSSNGRYALDFDGTNDFGDLAPVSLSANPEIAIYARFKTRSNTTGQSLFLTGNEGIELQAIGLAIGAHGEGSCSIEFAGNNPYAVSSGILSNTEHVIVAQKSSGQISTTSQIWIDGNLKTAAAGASTGTPNYTATRATIAQFGQSANGLQLNGTIIEIRVFNRLLNQQEIRIIGSRPGIAYELAPRRRSSSAVQFNRRRRLLLGASN
jgi:hypothetical protein